MDKRFVPAGSGNLNLNEAIGSLVNAFEIFSLRMLVFLHECEKRYDTYNKEKFLDKWERKSAGQLLKRLVPSYEKCDLADPEGIQGVEKTSKVWLEIICTRNDVIHSIPYLIDDSLDIWGIRKPAKIDGKRTYRSHEVQPEHIYFFGKKISRFTDELVDATSLLAHNRQISDVFKIASEEDYRFDVFGFDGDLLRGS